jgi:hypothetical protein
MTQRPDYDPIRKSWREADSYNLTWLKNGEKMTWMQRIGFAIMSLIIFSSGLLVGKLAINSLLNGEFLSLGTIAVAGGIVVGLFFLILGVLGLRNVLRF